MLKNLTPHQINIFAEDGKTELLSIASTGVARCSVQKEKVGEFGAVPVFKSKYGDVSGLPDAKSNVVYIVSFLVKQALPDREDLVSPGELIRNEKGQPIGCIGLNT